MGGKQDIQFKVIEVVLKSKKYNLNKQDLTKALTGAGLALGGAVITILSDLIPTIDWGEWTPVVTAVAAVLLNFVRKWLAGR